MDTEKWKSVLVPREVYEGIKDLAKEEGRTIGGQLRIMFEMHKGVPAESRSVYDNIEDL
jgi:hypothetical protein